MQIFTISQEQVKANADYIARVYIRVKYYTINISTKISMIVYNENIFYIGKQSFSMKKYLLKTVALHEDTIDYSI